MNAQRDTYGQHLMVRLCRVEQVDLLDDAAAVSEILTSLVRAVKMRILAGPCVGAEGGDASHYGYSAIVILYESHAAIHTYPRRGELFLDLFSCRSFDVHLVFENLVRRLGHFVVTEYDLLDRGNHWRAPVQGLLAEWMETR